MPFPLASHETILIRLNALEARRAKLRGMFDKNPKNPLIAEHARNLAVEAQRLHNEVDAPGLKERAAGVLSDAEILAIKALHAVGRISKDEMAGMLSDQNLAKRREYLKRMSQP